MNLFVTGTDTGVGKTYVTRLLLDTLRSLGVRATGYKPIACGDRDDARDLAAVSACGDIDRINPVHFKTPVAPYVAGIIESQTVDKEALLAGYRSLATENDTVIVERVGGWEVPVSAGYRISDFARDLGLPVLLVAGNKLGALNHILLTIDAIRAKGLTCAGIILNQLEDELDTAMITNKGVIEDLSGVPLLDHLIHGQDFIDEDVIRSLFPEAAGSTAG